MPEAHRSKHWWFERSPDSNLYYFSFCGCFLCPPFWPPLGAPSTSCEVLPNVTIFTGGLGKPRRQGLPNGCRAAFVSALRNSHKVEHSRECTGEAGSSKLQHISYLIAALRALIALCKPKLRQQAGARPIKNGW